MRAAPRDRLIKGTFIILLTPLIWAELDHPTENHKPQALDVQYVYYEGELHSRRKHWIRSLLHHGPEVRRWSSCGLSALDPNEIFVISAKDHVVHEWEWKGPIGCLLDREPSATVITVSF